MKLIDTLLAIALPLALSAGCALEVDSSAEGLTIQTNNDFGADVCGQPIAIYLENAQWPVGTIVAGDMVFTQEGLVDYIAQNPGDRSLLIAEVALFELNMSLGLELPVSVLDELYEAEDAIMAPKEDNGDLPPLIAIEDFRTLADFNRFSDLECFNGGGTVALADEGPAAQRDLRENLTRE